MTRRGIRDITTVSTVLGRGRPRAAHEAYLEMAVLTRHRHRLLHLRGAGEARNAEIDERIREIDQTAAGLLRFIEEPPTAAPAQASPPTIIRVKDLEY